MLKSASAASKMSGRVSIPQTLMKKWTDYWKNLFIDYRQAFQDMRMDIQEEPNKALKWMFGLTSMYLLSKNNPNELEFKNTLRTIQNEAILVGEHCLNPRAAEHLQFLERCYNGGTIHYISFGIVSVMYLSEFSDNCSIYKAKCSYLQPSYLEFPSRIVDVGMMGRWWNIFMKTSDYDVNV